MLRYRLCDPSPNNLEIRNGLIRLIGEADDVEPTFYVPNQDVVLLPRKDHQKLCDLAYLALNSVA
jgi:hypothetical protein